MCYARALAAVLPVVTPCVLLPVSPVEAIAGVGFEAQAGCLQCMRAAAPAGVAYTNQIPAAGPSLPSHPPHTAQKQTHGAHTTINTQHTQVIPGEKPPRISSSFARAPSQHPVPAWLRAAVESKDRGRVDALLRGEAKGAVAHVGRVSHSAILMHGRIWQLCETTAGCCEQQNTESYSSPPHTCFYSLGSWQLSCFWRSCSRTRRDIISYPL